MCVVLRQPYSLSATALSLLRRGNRANYDRGETDKSLPSHVAGRAGRLSTESSKHRETVILSHHGEMAPTRDSEKNGGQIHNDTIG